MKLATDQLLETGDAARLLRVSPDMVRYLARNGRLPERRLPSGRRLFRIEDVKKIARERGIAFDA
jgi:excisionase family DNA binding protein